MNTQYVGRNYGFITGFGLRHPRIYFGGMAGLLAFMYVATFPSKPADLGSVVGECIVSTASGIAGLLDAAIETTDNAYVEVFSPLSQELSRQSPVRKPTRIPIPNNDPSVLEGMLTTPVLHGRKGYERSDYFK